MENKKIFQFVYSYTYPEICSFVEKCRTDLANEFHITFKEWKDKKFISQKYSEQFKTTEVAFPPPTPGAIQKKIIQTNKDGCKYKLFRIDVYFIEYLLSVDIDEKGHTDRELIFEKKRQEALEKKLGRKLIRINRSKESYDADYDASRVQTCISKFKDRQLQKLNKKLEVLEDKIEKFTGQITQ